MQDDRRAGRRGVLELPDRAGLVARDPRHREHALAGAVGQDHRRDVAEAANRTTGRSPAPRARAPPRVWLIRPCARSTSAAGSADRAVEHRADRLVGGVAASGPWPRPSHSTPVSVLSDSDRAEDVAALGFPVDRPGQPGAGPVPERGLGPEPGHQRGAVASHRVQVAEVGQPLDRAQPDAQGAAGGVAVAQRRARVAQPGPASMVTSSIPALSPSRVMRSSIEPSAGVLVQVGGRLRHREHQLVGAVGRELEPARPAPRRRRGRRRRRSDPRPGASAVPAGRRASAAGSP